MELNRTARKIYENKLQILEYKKGFNLWSGLFCDIWMIHNLMFAEALIVLCIELLIGGIATITVHYLFISTQIRPKVIILSWILLIIKIIICGVLGNLLLKRNIKRKLKKIDKENLYTHFLNNLVAYDKNVVIRVALAVSYGVAAPLFQKWMINTVSDYILF